MSIHTNETTIANLQAAMTRLIEERDALKQERDDMQSELCSVLATCTAVVNDVRAESADILAAFDNWGVWQFSSEQPRDMCGMPLDRQMEHATAERMRQLWVRRHPEFFEGAE